MTIDNENLGVPALCFFQRLISKDLGQSYMMDPAASSSMVISLFVLASGYSMRVVKLPEKATAFSRLWIRTKPGLLLKNLRNTAVRNVTKPILTPRKLVWVLAYVLLETLHIMLRAHYDIFESMLWEILWLALSLHWGTSKLFRTRFYHTDVTENTRTFGQLFPVLLLVLPLLSIVETYYKSDVDYPQNGIGEDLADQENAVGCRDINKCLLRVGQWPARTATEHASIVVTDDQIPLRRLGTDIQIEEERLSSTRHRLRLHLSSSAANRGLSPTGTVTESSTTREGLIMDAYCYTLEWFWILVLILIFGISGIIFYVLFLSGFGVRYLTTRWIRYVQSIVFMQLFCYSFTATFILLSYYHKEIGRRLKTYLRWSPRKQRATLRVIAWFCLPFMLSCHALVLSLFP